MFFICRTLIYYVFIACIIIHIRQAKNSSSNHALEIEGGGEEENKKKKKRGEKKKREHISLTTLYCSMLAVRNEMKINAFDSIIFVVSRSTTS